MASNKRLKQLKKLAALTPRLPLPSGPTPVKAPLDVVTRFAKAWNARDAAAVAELFAEDADFVNVVGLWWTSRRSIERALRRGFSDWFAGSEFIVEKLSQRLVGEDGAVVLARWRIEGQKDPAGEASPTRRGVTTAVLTRLADGTWLCVSWQNTDIAAAADTNLVVDGVVTPTSYIEPTA
ncbi:MAG: SgcJ/EcaC family oxidoreductase [Propionicimonas sp.]|uniref:YybH family protein n=1 Tax=Propionicimonas sp. TaxID=1955623 RepID=UPI003D0FBCAC